MADKRSIETRKLIHALITKCPISRNNIAIELGMTETAVGYHLTQMRKAGTIYSKKNRWHLGKDSTKPQPVKKVKPDVVKVLTETRPTSIKLSLLAAREAIDEALHKIEEVENILC